MERLTTQDPSMLWPDDVGWPQDIGALRRRRLDRTRPLWEIWFLPGLPDGRAGLFMKVHHAIADGVAGMATLGAFFDTVPHASVAHRRPWAPAPRPSPRELAWDNVRGHVGEAARAFAAATRPVTSLRHVRPGWPAVRETIAGPRAPRTSINRPIGPGRRLAVIRGSLDLAEQVAHSHDAKVNDVLMAAVAGGLRDLLSSRGEHVEDAVLLAYVLVSLHRERGGQARGNLDGLKVAGLPIGEPDPVRRLRLITAETAERKKKSRPATGALLRNGFIQRSLLRVMAHQRWANTYVANVPGPSMPLYLARALLLEVFPVVPLIGNVALGVGALSYAGQFNLTAVAGRDACPDLAVFTDGVRKASDSLTLSTSVQQSHRTKERS